MLKMREAIRMSEYVYEYAEEIGTQALAVVVLDKGGHVLSAMREEEAGILRFDIAKAKAWGALGMGFGTRTFASMAQGSEKFQAFVGALSVLSDGNVIPTQGGVLIRNANGDLLGAIGVSGDSSERDEACILYAIRKMEMLAQP